MPNIIISSGANINYHKTVDKVYKAKPLFILETIHIDPTTNNINLPEGINNLTNFDLNKNINKKFVLNNLDKIISKLDNDYLRNKF